MTNLASNKTMTMTMTRSTTDVTTVRMITMTTMMIIEITAPRTQIQKHKSKRTHRHTTIETGTRKETAHADTRNTQQQ